MGYDSRHRPNDAVGGPDEDGCRDLDVGIKEPQSDTVPKTTLTSRLYISSFEFRDELHTLYRTLNHERSERDELAERLADTMNALEQVIEQKDEAVERLNNILETLEQVIAQKDEAAERLSSIMETLEQTIQQKDEIEHQHRDVQEELAGTNARISEYESEVKEREQVSESLRQMLGEKEQTLAQLEAELRKIYEKIGQIEGDLEHKGKELAIVRQVCKEQEATFSDRLREAQEKVHSLTQAYTEEKADLTKRFNDALEKCTSLEVAIKEQDSYQTKQLKDVEQKCADLKRTNKRLEEQVANVSEKFASLKDHLPESEKSVEGNASWDSLPQAKQKDAESRSNEVQTALDARDEQSKTRQGELEKEVQALEKRVREMQSAQKSREDQLQSQLDRERKGLTDGQKQLEVAVQKNEELNRKIKTLRSELTLKDIRILDLEVKIEEVTTETEATVRALCEQIDSLEGRLCGTSPKQTELIRREEDLAAELSRMRTEFKEELARKDTRLREQERKMESLTAARKPSEAAIICVDRSRSMVGGGIATAAEDLRELESAIGRRNPSGVICVLGHRGLPRVVAGISKANSAMESGAYPVASARSEEWLDVIERAHEILKRHKGTKPKASCRIICIGNGCVERDSDLDGTLNARRQALFSQLIADGIVVHTVVRGQAHGKLSKIAQETGGRSFDSRLPATFAAPELIGVFDERRGLK